MENDKIRDDFLAAMRNVANSVTIVTSNGEAGKGGATVSSFCSVSADPPTVLVCLNKESRTAQLVEANQKFAVNVLPENAQELAIRFAKPGIPAAEQFLEGNWSDEASKLPTLSDATVFSCSVSEKIESTSHHIFIGSVSAISIGSANPLIYIDQTFKGLQTD